MITQPAPLGFGRSGLTFARPKTHPLELFVLVTGGRTSWNHLLERVCRRPNGQDLPLCFSTSSFFRSTPLSFPPLRVKSVLSSSPTPTQKKENGRYQIRPCRLAAPLRPRQRRRRRRHYDGGGRGGGTRSPQPHQQLRRLPIPLLRQALRPVPHQQPPRPRRRRRPGQLPRPFQSPRLLLRDVRQVRGSQGPDVHRLHLRELQDAAAAWVRFVFVIVFDRLCVLDSFWSAIPWFASVIWGLCSWEMNSFGYHGDDGFLFRCGKGEQFGPKFAANDTVGGGINYAMQEFFFTYVCSALSVWSY